MLPARFHAREMQRKWLPVPHRRRNSIRSAVSRRDPSTRSSGYPRTTLPRSWKGVAASSPYTPKMSGSAGIVSRTNLRLAPSGLSTGAHTAVSPIASYCRFVSSPLGRVYIPRIIFRANVGRGRKVFQDENRTRIDETFPLPSRASERASVTWAQLT